MTVFNYKKFIGLNDDIIKIRTAVFIDEQGFKDEFDETDETCSHIVLYDRGKCIATCVKLTEREFPVPLIVIELSAPKSFIISS